MSPHSVRSRRLLLVEDSPADAAFVEALVNPPGRIADQIVNATDLREAAALLQAERFDAVLLDLRLPDGEGIECVRVTRAASPDVPIVVLTGMEGEPLALACLGAGAQDYVAKAELRSDGLRRAIAYAIARVRERLESARVEELQARLITMLDSASDAILTYRTDGTITSWNRGAEAIFGYSRDEAVGADLTARLRVTSGEAQRWLSGLLSGEAKQAHDLICETKRGTQAIVSVAPLTLREPEGQLRELGAVCHDVTERRRLTDELAHSNAELVARDQQMRTLTARMNAVREEERTRISREVHDELGQLLSGLKMDLRRIERGLSRDAAGAIPGSLERLHGAEDLIDRIISSVQRIAIELRPSALDQLGLSEALRDEAQRFSLRTGTSVEVEVQGSGHPDDDVATALFRICQELLTNVARHARANRVAIELVEEQTGLKLRVTDDGVGFDRSVERLATSLGLLGIRERAGAFGGRFEIQGRPGSGTVATVYVPCGTAKEV